MNKLQIGCGNKKKKDFINIDINPKYKPDKVINIEKGFPKNWTNKFDYIYSCHCLEHIRPLFWEFVLNEINRVAKPNCILELDLPFDSIRTRGNVHHYKTFTWDSFKQLQPEHRAYSKLKMRSLIRHSKIKKIFFTIFPFLKYNLHFKFRVIK